MRNLFFMELEKEIDLQKKLEKIAFLFEKHGFLLEKQQIFSFYTYYESLIDFNNHTNLTAITDFDEVVVKHFIDSCFLSKEIEPNSTVCDIGSGAGFPGIPLKIIRPDLKIVLVDSLNKRINFLNQTISQLGLKDIQAVHSRIQEFSLNNRERFDYTTARAVAPLNILLEYCIPVTKVGGKVLAMKSQKTDEEIELAKNSLFVLGGKIDLVKTYNLNCKDEISSRTIIEISKQKVTDKKYPRLKDLIKKKPL